MDWGQYTVMWDMWRGGCGVFMVNGVVMNEASSSSSSCMNIVTLRPAPVHNVHVCVLISCSIILYQ